MNIENIKPGNYKELIEIWEAGRQGQDRKAGSP